ncbi:MAG: GNAT family N-acyltransferase [Myxococcota bacterium]
MLDQRAEIITSRSHLDAARNLLYRVYCQEQGWYPASNNPSEQHVRSLQSGDHGLVDAYDDVATWIGLFHEQAVVGCVRLIRRPQDNGRLEIENYFDLVRHVEYPHEIVECNRLAIEPSFRRREGMALLHLKFLDLVVSTGESVLIAAMPGTGKLAIEYMGVTDTGLSFRYAQDDPEEAHIYLLRNRGAAVPNQRDYLRAKIASRRKPMSDRTTREPYG